MKVTDPPVIVTERFEASPSVLWTAITNVIEMRQWYFSELQEFRAEEGFETQFTIEFDEKQYSHVWKIIEVKPQSRIVYDWSYAGLPGRGLVTWELEPDGSGTRLKLTNSILEDFPHDDPAFRRESCESGWAYFINQQLKGFVD